MSDNIIKFNPGQVIFKQEDACASLYIIRSGQVGIFRSGKGDTKIPLGIVSSGEFLGELSLILERPHSSMAIALTDVQAVKLAKKDVDNQLTQVSPWISALLKNSLARLQKTNEILRKNNLVDSSLQENISAALKNAGNPQDKKSA